MKSIAILSSVNPYTQPLNGGKLDILTRIKALSEIDDVQVDLYLLTKPDEILQFPNSLYECPNIRNILQFRMKQLGIRLIFDKYPISVSRRFIPEVTEELKRHHYDAVIYEGEYMVKYRIKGSVCSNRHIIRMHNIESEYRNVLSKASDSLIKSIAEKAECLKYRSVEKKLCEYFDNFLFISKSEQESFMKKYPHGRSKFVYLPTSSEHIAKEAVRNNSSVILYYGSLDIYHNYLSVLWFIKEIFPIIISKNKDVVFKVVGKIEAGKKETLESFSPNIQVCGYVDNIDAEIENSAMVVMPILEGTGVKTKVIDALAHGQIVFTTSKGTEGTDLINRKHLFISDNPNDIAEFCSGVIDNREHYREMADAGLDFIKKNHSVEYQSLLLRNII